MRSESPNPSDEVEESCTLLDWRNLFHYDTLILSCIVCLEHELQACVKDIARRCHMMDQGSRVYQKSASDRLLLALDPAAHSPGPTRQHGLEPSQKEPECQIVLKRPRQEDRLIQHPRSCSTPEALDEQSNPAARWVPSNSCSCKSNGAQAQSLASKLQETQLEHQQLYTAQERQLQLEAQALRQTQYEEQQAAALAREQELAIQELRR